MLHVMAYRSAPNRYPVFYPFLRILKTEFLIQALISRQIVNQNVVYVHQNLSLGIDSQRKIKFSKMKLPFLFNGSLNTLRLTLRFFLVRPVYQTTLSCFPVETNTPCKKIDQE